MLRRVGRWIDCAEDVCVTGSALALAAMMLIMVAQVVFRYLLGAPLGWSLGFIEDYLLVAFFFLAISYTFRVRGHVSIDLLVRRLPSRTQRGLTILSGTLSLVFFALICYSGILLTQGAWVTSETPPPGGAELSWPLWTSYMFVPIGTAVLAVRLFYTIATGGEGVREQSSEIEV